jgi:hypothetical protein
MTRTTTALFLTILLAFISCELYEQDDYQEYYVVESYLVANDFLPPVRLSTTSPIGKEYNFNDNALSGADVQIRRLDADSNNTETYSYQPKQAGIYLPSDSIIVQDKQLYQLHITTENGDLITATTYVPGDFESINELQNQYTYQSEEQIEITTTPSSYITDRQTYYIFTVNAANPDSSNLTPFYRDLVIDQDNKIENFTVNSSGIINEGNYQQNQDGNIILRVPWLAIAFYDTNDVVANAIDDNMYDFLRSQDVQTGGATLSPGEIQNIQYNVNGAIGIFGSMASDTNRVEIIKPESN